MYEPAQSMMEQLASDNPTEDPLGDEIFEQLFSDGDTLQMLTLYNNLMVGESMEYDDFHSLLASAPLSSSTWLDNKWTC